MSTDRGIAVGYNASMAWQRTSDPPPLLGNDIHVWRFSLEADGQFQRYLPLLANDEVRRAERFLFERHREHFVLGRAAARCILANYVELDPAAIDYAYDNLGKPRFRDEALNATYRFNFSNSDHLGLLAMTREFEIGVDLEKIRDLTDMLGLAKRYFADTETEQLLALPPLEQPAAFFRFWTRKEAYLKAVGKGLTFPLRNVKVTLADDENCRVCEIDGDPEEASEWSLSNLEPMEGFKGALAVRRNANTITLFDFKPR